MKKYLLLLIPLFFASIAFASTLQVQQGGTGLLYPLTGFQTGTCLTGNGLAPIGTTTCGGGSSSTFGTSSLSALLPLIYTQSSSLAQLSTLFSTTTNTGLGNNLFIYTNNAGVLTGAASSSLSLPNAALQNSTIGVTANSPLTGGGTPTLGGSTSIGCQTASGSQAGCLSSADWTTFNNKGSGTVTSVTGTYPILSSGGTTPVISTAFGTTSTWGIANDGFVYTSHTGIPLVAASSSLDLPNTALQNSSVTVNTTAPLGGGGAVSLGGAALTLTCTSCSTFAYPFTPSTFGIAVSATSTPILDYPGLIAATSTFGTIFASSSITDQPLATPAGTFIAADPTGKLIATTSPSGSNSAFSPAANYATVAGLPSYTYSLGVITEVSNGALSVDGNNPTVGQIILVKNESGACMTGSGACNNGLYNVTAAGSAIAAFVLTRNSNYNSSSNVIPGIVTYVISGATLADDFWALTSAAPITVGTTALNYTEVSGGGASVTSVANSDSTLTISPTTGNVVASLNLAHTNTWSVLQNFAALTATNATTTSLATGSTTVATLSGAGLASCSGATNAVTYTLATGLFGCNSITGTSFAYPFTPTTNFNIPVSETTTPLYDTLGIFASSTTGVASWIDQLNIGSTTSGTLATSTDFGNFRVAGNASTTNLFVLTTASTTNLNISSIRSALVLTGTTGATSAYGGSACTANQFLTTISALGACGSSAVTGAFFGNVAANTVFGNATGASANPSFFATSSLFTIGTGLTQNSNTLGLTIPVVVSSGGTNATSFTGNNLIYANSAGTGLVDLGSATTTASAAFGILALNSVGNAAFTYASSTEFTSGGSTLGTPSFFINSLGNVTAKDVATTYSGLLSPVQHLTMNWATTTTWTATTSGAYAAVDSVAAPFSGTVKDIVCMASTTKSFLGIAPFINGAATTPSYFVASSTIGTTTLTSGNTFVRGQLIAMFVGTTTTDANAIAGECTFDIVQTT